MIGNDIVDLRQAAKDSNWKRPRFLNKIFTAKEQLIISTSENKEHMVWLLWSMKEAAYKAYVRETKHRFFNPKRIECQLGSTHQGTVCIDEKLYDLKSVITSDYVHSVATNAETKHLEVHLFKLPVFSQSETVKAKVIHQLSCNKGIDSGAMEIKKTALGIPNVFFKNEQILQALSISHHGKYGAFAMC
ncbi:MAG: 4-phosphopantetheinyl transferase family protein [Algicola sp.]|nr:4-phosphopantetheinyl transferase family protein [Algicola sp.]